MLQERQSRLLDLQANEWPAIAKLLKDLMQLLYIRRHFKVVHPVDPV